MQPWFLEMKRRADLGIADCTKCKESTPALARQSLGCGYEPTADGRVHLAMWQPPSGEKAYRGPELTVCAGYTTGLPEVREAALARCHWDTGNIGAVFGGEMPTDDLLNAIVILVGASNDVQRWCMTPQKDGGGGA